MSLDSNLFFQIGLEHLILESDPVYSVLNCLIDCPDLLNLGLFRPIFSPTDFIQIKGRGTRKHNFLDQLFDPDLKDLVKQPLKTSYKLFDFFANCEYFETKFNYDEILKLPKSANFQGGEEEKKSRTP